jgi:hypothetical protein
MSKAGRMAKTRRKAGLNTASRVEHARTKRRLKAALKPKDKPARALPASFSDDEGASE